MSVVISPATMTRPVVISVSQATRPLGSSFRIASRTESEIWSAILSGWPSVTDSDVNENERAAMGRKATYPFRPSLFRGRSPAHELLHKRRERRAVENGADALRDREFYLEPPGEVSQDRRRGQPLHDHPDLGHRILRPRAAGDELPRAAVPPRRRPAGHDQVPHP